MSIEDAIAVLVVVQIAQFGGFMHHLYECRKVQRTLGRILQRLGMED